MTSHCLPPPPPPPIPHLLEHLLQRGHWLLLAGSRLEGEGGVRWEQLPREEMLSPGWGKKLLGHRSAPDAGLGLSKAGGHGEEGKREERKERRRRGEGGKDREKQREK